MAKRNSNGGAPVGDGNDSTRPTLAIKTNGKGQVFSHVRQKWLVETPEERGRQAYVVTLDDERIKAGRTLGDDYFDELLSRIRDIRASERLFYQRITDIYATSVDYDANVEMTREFSQLVQNKMHWAAQGHTAAEIVRLRADAAKPNRGLTAWKNALDGPIRKTDVTVAKNYLTKDEIESLNLIVSAYLDFAELQTRGRRPMHVADWIAKLDDFLRLGERDILNNLISEIRLSGGWKVTGCNSLLHLLTVAQRNAIDLLVLGRTDGEVAEAVGVHRATFVRWRLRHRSSPAIAVWR